MFGRLFGGRARHGYDAGIAHFNAGRLVDAITAFDAALEHSHGRSDPDVTLARFYRAEAHARLGRAELDAGRPLDALRHLDAALVDHPAYPDLHLQRGIALLLSDDPLAAERAAHQALQINERLVDAAVVLVIALHRQGNVARARELAATWRETATRSGSALADCFADPGTALDRLRAERARRMERRLRIERVESLLHDGYWAQAEARLTDLLDETPEYPDLRLRMAVARAAQGDFEEASSHLAVALQRNPDFADALVLSGIVDLGRDHVRQARTYFEHAERAGEPSMVTAYGLTLCDLRTGDETRALERLSAIRPFDGLGREGRALRAALYARVGDADAAETEYQGLIDTTNPGPASLDAASWALDTGRLDLAQRALGGRTGEGSDPDTVLALAELARRQGRYARVLDLLEAGTADHPEHPGLLWALAREHGRRGEIDVALRRLGDLEALGHRVPGAAALEAGFRRRRGDLDGAERALTEQAPRETNGAVALETLFVLRLQGETERVHELWERWRPLCGLDLRWRIQDPTRWSGPIPVWPSSPPSA